MNTEATTPQTIVLIHGMWMTPLSWEHWIERYTARGHRVIAPAWPGLDAAPKNTIVSILLGFQSSYDEMGKLASEGKLEAKSYPVDTTNGGITFGESFGRADH